jgi:cold shock CspA family protein
MPRGQITRLEPQLGFGFLIDDSGMDWFFVREDVGEGGLERLQAGDRVVFTYKWTPKGPRAGDIRRETPQHVA